MRRVRRNRRRKNYLPVIIIVVVCILVLMGVGYSIITETLSITGTATLKPPTENTAKTYILGKMGATSSEQNTKGLYIDDTEYFYKGTSCDNYIKFNGNSDVWQIISFNDDSIKIVREFDTSLTSAWNSTATDVSWENSTLLSLLKTWYQNNLSSLDNKIVSAPSWNVNQSAKTTPAVLDTTASAYTGSNIGLITTYEYSRSNSTSNTFDTTWMYNGQYVWTMTKYSGSTTQAWRVNTKFNNSKITSESTYYRPVVFIKISNELTGTGTIADPFIIN